MRFPAYPAYKDSGIEWLGEVPEHWTTKRLKYTASINDDSLPETTDPEYEFSYVDIGSVNQVEGITQTEKMIFDTAPSRARRMVAPGDTIVSTVRTYLKAIAPIRETEETLIVSTGFAVVRPRNVGSGYLSWALRESIFVESIVARSVGVSYPAVNASEVGCISIPLPSPTEQRAIADFLDIQTSKIDALLAKKRELIEKLKEKRTALISRTVTRGLPPEAARDAGLDPQPPMKASGVEWLGEVPEHWKVKKLKYLSANEHGEGIQIGPFGGMLTEVAYDEEGDFKVYGQENILSGDFSKGIRWLDKKQVDSLAKYRICTGDILFTRKGSIGGCCMVPDGIYPGIIDSDTIRMRVNRNRLAPDYILFAFRYSAYLQAQIQEVKRGAILSGLNTSTIANLMLLIPPFTEQRAIANFLDYETARIDRLTAKAEEAIERLREYRTALITAAVTGKIDVREAAA
jgi:type I restriction enzyme S subunit